MFDLGLLSLSVVLHGLGIGGACECCCWVLLVRFGLGVAVRVVICCSDLVVGLCGSLDLAGCSLGCYERGVVLVNVVIIVSFCACFVGDR